MHRSGYGGVTQSSSPPSLPSSWLFPLFFSLFFYIHCLSFSLRVVISKMKKKQHWVKCVISFFPPLHSLSLSLLPRLEGSPGLGGIEAKRTVGRMGLSPRKKKTWPPSSTSPLSLTTSLSRVLRCRWTCRRGLQMTSRRWQ